MTVFATVWPAQRRRCFRPPVAVARPAARIGSRGPGVPASRGYVANTLARRLTAVIIRWTATPDSSAPSLPQHTPGGRRNDELETPPR